MNKRYVVIEISHSHGKLLKSFQLAKQTHLLFGHMAEHLTNLIPHFFLICQNELIACIFKILCHILVISSNHKHSFAHCIYATKQLEKKNLSPPFQYVAGHYQQVQSQETQDLHKLPVTFYMCQASGQHMPEEGRNSQQLGSIKKNIIEEEVHRMLIKHLSNNSAQARLRTSFHCVLA
jgi:hypothetical protein